MKKLISILLLLSFIPFAKAEYSIESSFASFSRFKINKHKAVNFEYEQISLELSHKTYSSENFEKFEKIIGFSYNFINEGFGNYIASLYGGLRKHLRDSDRFLVPYVQFCIGVALNDAYGIKILESGQEQNYIGSQFEFLLSPGIGLQINVSKNQAIILKGDWEHYSNGNMASRNDAMDCIGWGIGWKINL